MSDGSVEDMLTEGCTACGHRLEPAALYCTSCGAPALPPPHRRPLFVDELDAQQRQGALTYAEQPGYAAYAEPAPTPPPAEDPPPFFANAETVLPRQRRHGRGGAVLLALAVVAMAGVVGFTLGRDGDSDTPKSGAGPSAGSSPSASSDPGATPSAPPKEQLLRISRDDTRAASRLIGNWVPQLAAVSAGVGGDAGWSDALSHYEQLKATYPDVLLLDTGEWPSSYVKPGMYAVVVPQPAKDSLPVLQWCVEHHLDRDQCGAKRLDTEGDPDDNYDAQ